MFNVPVYSTHLHCAPQIDPQSQHNAKACLFQELHWEIIQVRGGIKHGILSQELEHRPENDAGDGSCQDWAQGQ